VVVSVVLGIACVRARFWAHWLHIPGIVQNRSVKVFILWGSCDILNMKHFMTWIADRFRLVSCEALVRPLC
jgi:hypothetical protein